MVQERKVNLASSEPRIRICRGQIISSIRTRIGRTVGLSHDPRPILIVVVRFPQRLVDVDGNSLLDDRPW